jgi:cell division protein FtsB
MDHSVASFMILFMHFPGGNKEEQTISVITINHVAVKENFWLPWVLIILLQIINFLFFLIRKEKFDFLRRSSLVYC